MITSSIKLQPREAKLPVIQKSTRTRAKTGAAVPRQVRKSPTKQSVKQIAKKKVQEVSVKEIAERELTAPRRDEQSGNVHLRYNHYNKPFSVHNGVIKWEEVDEEYSFSFIFAGRYLREMYLIPSPDPFGRSNGIHGVIDETKPILRDKEGKYFIEMVPGNHYMIKVTEDAEAGLQETGLRVTDKPLVAAEREEDGKKCQSGNQAVNDITNELLKMNVNDLNGAEARALREQRDIEDVLFS